MLENWMESERRIEDKVLTVREEEKKNPSGDRLCTAAAFTAKGDGAGGCE